MRRRKSKIRHMSYRKGIATIIFLPDQRSILLGERSKERGQWQIPQGGSESGESIADTLQRELLEEVGVKSLKIVGRTTDYISYNWPIGLFEHSKFIGQEHVYFLLDGTDINPELLRPTEEFVKFGWFPINEARALAPEWKRDALDRALREFGLLA